MPPARFQLFRVAPGGVAWRFMASNNRQLAESVTEAVDEAAARRQIEYLRLGLASARASVFLDASGRWRWEVRIAGSPVAGSSRFYYRRVECDATLTQFMSTGTVAPVSPTVAIFPRVAAVTAIDADVGTIDLRTVVPLPRRAGDRSGGTPGLRPRAVR